jgi:hypothetical protein
MECLKESLQHAHHQLDLSVAKLTPERDASIGSQKGADISSVEDLSNELLKALESHKDNLLNNPDTKIDSIRELEATFLSINCNIARTCDEMACLLFAFYCKLRAD